MKVAKKNKPPKTPPFDRVVYRIEESRAGAGYEAVCPELVITGFGDTAEDAKNMLRRQVSEYLEDCEKLEILDETLIEAGFYYNGEVWMIPWPRRMFLVRWLAAAKNTSGALEWLYSSKK